MAGKNIFVLDTSIFTNPQIYRRIKENLLEAMDELLTLMKNSNGEFFMPLSTYNELRKIVDLKELLPKFESTIKIRAPKRYNLTIPAIFLYEFVGELRGRINKGLRLSEEHLRMAVKDSLNCSENDKKEKEREKEERKQNY